jgi:tRNA pseudouridine38-40 synthase
MGTRRFKLTLAYRGTAYHGWQSQPAMETYTGAPPPPGEGIPTIQGALVKALITVLRHPVSVVGSSRTDAGVHAKGQIAHVDTELTQIPTDGLRRAVNAKLPGDILVRRIEPVPDTFDAIHSTIRKRYQYFIWNASDRPVFFNDLAWHRWHKLDVAAMNTAAAMLVGQHDFASFARPGHGRINTVRTVYGCEVTSRASHVVIGIEGSGFLWNMVRIIVGTLVQVGIGHHTPDEIPAMLAARDRQAAGPTAPPHGLYLQWIRTKLRQTAESSAMEQAVESAPPTSESIVGDE